MKKANFELKNVKSFEGMEGIGLNASIYVNGKRSLFYIDDAHGGGGYINQVFDSEGEKIVNDYIESHPEVKSDINGEPFSYKYGIDDFISELLKEYETAKVQKAIRRKIQTAVVIIDSADPFSYRWYDFKRPLSSIPEEILKKHITNIKAKLKPNEQIVNEFNF